MAGVEKFIGYAVSIDCGDILGIYQGQVSSVDSKKQTLSIVKACRNGIPCKIQEITISSPDIQGLRILKSPEEMEDERRKLEAPSASERSSGTSLTSSTSSVSIHKRVHPLRDAQPAYQPPPLDTNRRYAKEYQSERRLTPKKNRNRNRSVSNDDCFNVQIDDSFKEDFDFEKNLAKFDKRAVWEELDNSMKPDVVRNAEKRNEIPDPNFYRQISVPRDQLGEREYATDTGLIVPSVTEELRRRIYGAAEQLGYTAERISETCGRGITDLLLQLVAGKHWLSPANANQRPSVVFLCCQQTYQSAWCINAARHLANRQVSVYLVLCQDQASSLPTSPTIVQELSLYKSTPGRFTTDVRELAEIADNPVDVIVDAVDCSSQHHSAPFYRAMVDYTNRNKAPVLAVDPYPDLYPSQIDIKWSICPILPLSLASSCGNVYLCDLGFTKKLFSMVGVKYASPFAHHFVVPLRVNK